MTKVGVLKMIVLSGSLAVALLAGCSENECPAPYCCIPDPALENIWPSEDQMAWTYEYVQQTWDWPGMTTYDDIDSVPPAPTMDEIEALLGDHPIGGSPDSIVGIYRLKFDGDTTTVAGVTAQNLTEMLLTDDPGILADALARRDGVFRRLALTRTDRHRHSASLDTFITVALYPLFLRGGAWENTGEWIVTYGDHDTLPDWKFLEANLEAGHEFTHELTSSDAVLHCRVLRRVDFETEAGVFEKAIECLYLLDPGILTIVDVSGDPVGWTRIVEYGLVVYAPTVGPVYSYRRMAVEPGDPPSAGAGEVILNLIVATTTGGLAL